MANKDNKLRKDERLVGNHILKSEPDFYKISQLSRLFSFRVHKLSALGIFITNCLEAGTETAGKWLEMLILEKMQNLGTVPDEDFLLKSMAESKACIERHPEWYGMTGQSLPEEEEAQITEEVFNEYVADKVLEEKRKGE